MVFGLQIHPTHVKMFACSHHSYLSLKQKSLSVYLRRKVNKIKEKEIFILINN